MYALQDLYKRLGDVSLAPLADEVTRCRWIKDAGEIANIRRAVEIQEQAFYKMLPDFGPGVAERDLALTLDFEMLRLGADAIAFDTIAASGPRGALPHGRAGDRVIQPNEMVTFDFGCKYRGYCSDQTVTLCAGTPDAKQQEVCDVVREAHDRVIENIQPGMTGREGDALARDYITEKGYGEYFRHGLGHCVGLFIHEEPRLAPRDDTVLKPGLVITVEPGIYIPGWGGVRLEDLVVITDDGCEVLTSLPKTLVW